MNTEHVLERIRLCLPLPIDLNLDLDTLVNILRPTLIIHAQLQQIAILQLIRPTFLIRIRQPHMVQKRSRTALGVLDVKLSPRFDPNLCMRSRDDFGFERELVGPVGVGGGESES